MKNNCNGFVTRNSCLNMSVNGSPLDDQYLTGTIVQEAVYPLVSDKVYSSFMNVDHAKSTGLTHSTGNLNKATIWQLHIWNSIGRITRQMSIHYTQLYVIKLTLIYDLEGLVKMIGPNLIWMHFI